MSDDAIPTVQMLLLERIDGSKNMSRYYVLEIAPTLFGDTALVREWGRIGNSVRRCIDLHADAERAGEALSEWLHRKTKRGYEIAHRACGLPKLAVSGMTAIGSRAEKADAE